MKKRKRKKRATSSLGMDLLVFVTFHPFRRKRKQFRNIKRGVRIILTTMGR
jgi:hypothetical protein